MSTMSNYNQLGSQRTHHTRSKNAKFLCKCILLSVAGLVFVYLLINTINYREKHEINEMLFHNDDVEARLHQLLEQNYRIKWNAETIYYYKKELGIERDSAETKVATNKTNDKFKLPQHMTLACAFPGNSLHDHMWEYLSILALHAKFPSQIFPTISQKANNRLSSLLQSVNMSVINQIRDSDYDLAYARIMGHSTPIPSIETFEGKNVPILLEKFAKRYIEIIKKKNFQQFVHFDSELVEKSTFEMGEIKRRYGFNVTDSDIQFVGVYIDEETEMPVDYYKSAFLHFLQQNSKTLFIVICSPDARPYYISDSKFHLPSSLQEFENKIYFTKTATKGGEAELMEFTLMSLCNSTIVSNTYGALQAVINGGTSLFHRPNKTKLMYFIPYVMGTNIGTWLKIT